jgi:3-oxoacyl-[acyl-carrier protein] reductase
MSSLQGQVAIITGGGGGIGLATARALADAGAVIVLTDNNQQRLDHAATALEDTRTSLLPLCLDVTSEHDMDELADQTLAHFDRIDILVAAAGLLRLGPPTPLLELPIEEWDAIIAVNLRGVYLSNRAVLPTMVSQRAGQIINIASTSGREGQPLDSAYSASKAGVIGLSQAAAQEVARYGVRISTIIPGAVDTDLWTQNSPIPRPDAMLPPSRVAELILYLLNLPPDTVLLEPVLLPFRQRTR